MATEYEWVIEEMDGEDIVDVRSFDTLHDALKDRGDSDAVALRKARSNQDLDSVDSFSYAYLADGKLPSEFCDGSRVPAKFFEELGRSK